MTWDELFILQAMLIAQKSKDQSTKVGCVIVGQDNAVLSMGFNGFPRGVRERGVDARWQRPEKYIWTEHAERNAIYNAARHGIKISGAKAYLNWEPKPCSDCTRALIQSGIVEIIGPDRKFTGAGVGSHYHVDHSHQMLEESGVKVTVISSIALKSFLENQNSS